MSGRPIKRTLRRQPYNLVFGHDASRFDCSASRGLERIPFTR